ncbi:hypothetical protein PMIN01_11760 [Paraphaeosphaeria minitans]|uniref:Uncharacterized protein n=1 Tax=Paraphaeosphaeria minitans TaxID=565426 RepID=A0A9P6G671_9PLEO|nr:hypothetical protein PMIN01_11760 [Paraphaeosphaeria minitans]
MGPAERATSSADKDPAEKATSSADKDPAEKATFSPNKRKTYLSEPHDSPEELDSFLAELNHRELSAQPLLYELWLDKFDPVFQSTRIDAEHASSSSDLLTSSFVGQSLGELPVAPIVEKPLNIEQALASQLPRQFLVAPMVQQLLVPQPSLAQPFIDQPFIDQPFIDQPFIDQPFINQYISGEQHLLAQPTARLLARHSNYFFPKSESSQDLKPLAAFGPPPQIIEKRLPNSVSAKQQKENLAVNDVSEKVYLC